jgi:hypothetical protein
MQNFDIGDDLLLVAGGVFEPSVLPTVQNMTAMQSTLVY